MTRKVRKDAGAAKGNGAASPDAPTQAVADAPGTAAIQSAIVAGEAFGVACDMPPQFEMRDSGLYRISKEGTWHFVSAPFEVLAESRPEGNDDWGLLLRWRDLDGRVHEWILPRRLLAGEAVEVRAHLAARRLQIGSSRAAREALVEFLTRVSTKVRVRTVACTGWYFPPRGGAPCFALPGRTIGDVADERVRLDIDPAPRMYRVNGTLDGWREEVAAPCAGNSRLLLALACSFAAPLAGLLGEEGGAVNLVGTTSSGKTTALDVAASPWGAPSKSGPHSFVATWHNTMTAIEGTAATRNDGLLLLDEIGEAEAQRLSNLVYMLAGGAGKGRGAAPGGNRPTVTWRVLILSSGEMTVARAAEQGGRHVKAGVETRMLDVPAEVAGAHGVFEDLHGASGGAAFAQALRQATRRQHGVAGPAFLEWLTARLRADPDFVAGTLAHRVAAAAAELAPPDAVGEVQRAVRRLAMIAVGGELATEAGITGWPPAAASAGVAAVFRDWLTLRGGTGSREDFHIIAAVRRYVGAYWRSRFERVRDAEDDDAGAQAEPPLTENPRSGELAGWRWEEVNGIGERRWVFGMIPDIFDAHIVVPLGMEARDARARLHRAGLIRARVEGGAIRFTWKPRRIPGHGQPRLVVFTPGLLEGELADGD